VIFFNPRTTKTQTKIDMKRVFLVIITCLSVTVRADDTDHRISELESRIKALEQRLSNIERLLVANMGGQAPGGGVYVSREQIERAQKRQLATRILEDLRMLDGATDQYAIETNKTGGMHPTFADLQNYLKKGTQLYNNGGKDPLGNYYSEGVFTVDKIPKISPATFNALSDVADESFWSPYK
jgi:hypothetical protein